MRGYSRVDEDLDEYEEDGLDEYEDIEGEEYAEEEEEVEVEEEDPTPKREVLEYLELRQKLKEVARKKLAKQSGSGSNARDSKRSKLENFGSFFGPSRPVISERVIQESKSFLETQQEAPRVSSSQKDSKKRQVFGTSAPKNGMAERRPYNPIKTKVQKLKDTRDYSFLLSEDADVPRTANVPTPRSNSDARSTQVPSKSKASDHSGRQIPNGTVERRPGTGNSHMRAGMEERRPGTGNSYMRPGIEERRPGTGNTHIRPGTEERRLGNGNSHQKPPSGIRSDSKRPERSAVPEHKKQHPVSGHGSGSGWPAMPKELSLNRPSNLIKKVPSHMDRRVVGASADRKVPAASTEKRPSATVVKGAVPNVQRPLLKSQTLGIRQQSEERVTQGSKGKILPKQTLSSSKPQIKAPKQAPSRFSREEESYRGKPQPKPKPKPVRKFSDEEDDDELRAIMEIRKMFRYNPDRYAGDDDDLSDMEADFRTIQREENRSSRIAREEDERELKLIQEEEERERQRKLAKKRKMAQR